MWHEARKQEKKIRGILVNHKKRAERRREFYEKMKADPTQFLQLHGRPSKIHLDPAVALAADSPANMMPWQGQSDILIDRFDVRAHLDYIPDHPEQPDVPKNEDLSYEDRMGNYERYRIIVQNDFLGIEEDKFLHQLNLEEKFGPTVEVEKKSSKLGKGAAIPYSYDDSTPQPDPHESNTVDNNEDEDDDDSDIDFDLCVDVSQVNPQQATEMNVCGNLYGMNGNDFFSFLTRDIEEKESLRQAREQEEEKAMFSGRKSRRERRAYREKKLLGRKISPPSYAARSSPTYDPYRKSESKSPSRSPPVAAGQITYITSFGGDEEEVEQKPVVLAQSKCRKVATVEDKRTASKPGKASNSPSSTAKKSGSKSPVNSSKYRRNNLSRTPDSPGRYRRKKSRSPSRSPPSSKYRRNRSRSPRRGNRSRTPSPPGKYRRNIRSRSNSLRGKESPRYHRKSRSKSPYRRGNRSRSSSPRYGSRPNSQRYKRSNKSRSQSSDSRSGPRSRSPPPPIRRYYGSRRGKSSSLDLEDSSDSESKKATNNKPPHKNSNAAFGNSGAGSKQQVGTSNARERLKRKMQTLLNRQYKADKKAERLRVKKQEDERQEREDELREMAIKLRRRERDRRHRDQGDSDDSEEASWRSSSSDDSSSHKNRRIISDKPNRRVNIDAKTQDVESSPDNNLSKLVDY